MKKAMMDFKFEYLFFVPFFLSQLPRLDAEVEIIQSHSQRL